MGTGSTSTVIEHLCHVLEGAGAGLSDEQLLNAFIARKDEDAFQTLVRRHGPMVLGVCRRVLRNRQDVEDAFQASFLVLVRKASSLKRRESLANWLHGVAHRTALKARAMNARRQGREKQVKVMPEQPARWSDVERWLDEELAHLPEKYRLPVILCDLQGRSIKDATRQLGCPQGTLAGRLARGRTMLAKRLAKRGLALSGGSLAVLFSHHSASARVPASMVASTVQAAAGQAAISAQVAALTNGVLKAMLLSKLRTATKVLLMVALLSIGIGTFRYPASAGGQEEAPAPAQNSEFTIRAHGDRLLVEGCDKQGVLRVHAEVARYQKGQGVLTLEGNPLIVEKNDGKFITIKGMSMTLSAGRVDVRPPDGKTGEVQEWAAPLGKDADIDDQLIQGTWHVVDMEHRGLRVSANSDAKDRKLMARWKLVFSRNCVLEGFGSLDAWRFQDRLNVVEPRETSTKATYKLAPLKNPKGIDIAGHKENTKGIYSLRGDDLKIAFRDDMARPEMFNTADDPHLTVITLRREMPPVAVPPPPLPAPPAAPPKVKEQQTGSLLFGAGVNSGAGLSGSITLNERNFDVAQPATSLDELQGTWALVSWDIGGQTVDVAQMPEAKRLSVFKGTEWKPAFMRGEGFTFTLDYNKTPHTIDFQAKENPKTTFLGIYELNGDTLKLCFGAGELEEKIQSVRPTSFVRPHDDCNRLVLKRTRNSGAGLSGSVRLNERNFDVAQPPTNSGAGSTGSVPSRPGDNGVNDLMERFRSCFKEGKYREAEMAVSKAHELDPDNAAVNAALELARNSMPRVGDINIVGHEKTPESVILPQLKLGPGDVLDESALPQAEKNLAALGVFVVDPKNGVRPTVTTVKSDKGTPYRDILVTVQEKPKLKEQMFPDGRSHDFGSVTRGTEAKCTFRITNTTTLPIQLGNIRATNGCLKSEVTKRRLEPNETGELQIIMDTRRFAGSKTVTVYLEVKNARGLQTHQFTITADSQEKGNSAP
jgi:RNA polymerase sigma factor (sigma-70 family)